MEKKKMNVLYKRDERYPITEISRIEAIANPPLVPVTAVYGDRQHFCIFHENWTTKVLGNRIFWKKLDSYNLTFKDGKFYGHLDSFFMKTLCKVFNIDWIFPWCFTLIGTNKTLFKAILKDKITNPEDLCKKYSKLYFKGMYSYRNLKEYACQGMSFSLWNLYYYCTNPNEGLRYLLDLREEEEKNTSSTWWMGSSLDILESDIRDFLYYCELLGDIKWNPKWSKKRLLAEHQKQIERVHLAEIEEKSDKPIAPSFSKSGLSLIIDERTCYEEGMYMHNCVHTCYWSQIKSGNYLIAKGDINGEHINLGINMEKTPKFDQVHTIRNGNVSDNTREFCVQWIEVNKETLCNTVNYIKGEKE